MTTKEWIPPFCANEVEDVPCPACGEERVHVREQERYCDGDGVEAYCAGCHAMMTIYASVDIAFGEPELIEGSEG